VNSTAAARLDSTVFYLDESIYSRTLVEALTSMGANVRTPKDACGFGAEDAAWLQFVGAQGWIVLMRDQRVRYRVLEVLALSEASVGAFVFIGGQASAKDTADVITRRLNHFSNVARSEPKPFLFTFGFTGMCNRVRVRKF
jgi:hypothetical protein